MHMNTQCIWLVSAPPSSTKIVSDSNELLLKSLKEHGIETRIVNPLAVAIAVTDAEIAFYENGSLMPVPHLVVFRKKRGAEEQTYTLAQALIKKGIPLFESVGGGGLSKSGTTIKRIGTFNTIPTLFGSKETIKINLKAELFMYPLIVKPSKGHHGKNVFLVSNESELHIALEKIDEELMVQKYIQIENEYRVMVVQGKAIGVTKKNGDGVAKNASVGGTFESAEREDIAVFAEKVALFQGGVVYGVDIAETNDGTLYVIECNRAPEFIEFNRALGVKVEDFIVSAILKCL